MKFSLLKTSLVSLGILTSFIIFQNCGNKTFSVKSSTRESVDGIFDEGNDSSSNNNSSGEGSSSSGSASGGDSTGGSASAGDSSGGSVSGGDSTGGSSTAGGADSGGSTTGSTPPPQVIDDTIDTTPGQDVTFTECKLYQEISVVSSSNQIRIPARTGEGICYYIRLMSSRTLASSGTRGEVIAPDVVARPHSRRDTATGMHPYVLGEINLPNLELLGFRNVAISSSFTNPKASMFIDNFFLIEQRTSVGTQRLWAYGTKDAEPSDGSKIKVSGVAVQDFYDFAPGGTATVTAIDLTSAVPPLLSMNIRFRGLDCGGSAVASDVFMVFH